VAPTAAELNGQAADWADTVPLPFLAADGTVFALKQVKLKGMKRVDREEAIDEVTQHAQHCRPVPASPHKQQQPAQPPLQ
jgi:hypothetical protein